MLVLSATALLIQEYLQLTGLDGLTGLSGVLDFLLAPAVYLFLRTLSSEEEVHGYRIYARHLLPFGLAVLLSVSLSVSIGPRWASDSAALFTFWTLGRFGIYAVYLIACLRLLPGLTRASRPETRSAAKGITNWLGLLGLAALFNLATTIAFVAGLISDPLIRLICRGLLAASAYGLGYLLMVHPVLSGRIHSFPNSNATGVSPARRARLRNFLIQEKAYLDPDLDLEALCYHTGLRRSEATAAIYQEFGEKFYDCLARLRHQEFLCLCNLPDNRDCTVLELAFAAGFNSKAAFYRTFSRFEGCSPAEYRRQHVTESLPAAE